MLTRDDHDRLAARFYASAMGDTPWADTLFYTAGMFRSSAVVVRVYDAAGNTFAAENSRFDPEFALEYYSGEIYANDPRRPFLENAPVGSIYYDHALYDVEAMARDPWCKEACDTLGVKYQLGAVLGLPNEGRAALALLSTDAEGHASREAIEAFSRLAPAVQQACALGHLVESQAATRAALLQALSQKADGVVLLGRAATPTFMNDAARAMLGAGDGLALSLGAFVTGRPPETRRLRMLVKAALTAGAFPGASMLVSRPSGRHPYVVSVMAAPPTERFLAGLSISCVVHIQDLATIRIPSHEALRTVFGLTEREADFAVELVRCAGLERAASHAGMSVNTARNHLQSISRKTGARGQTGIVQLLGSLP